MPVYDRRLSLLSGGSGRLDTLNHLVGARKQRRRDFEAERLRDLVQALGHTVAPDAASRREARQTAEERCH